MAGLVTNCNFHPRCYRISQYVMRHFDSSVQDGIIFRGERAVIPAELRNVLKEKIHSSHLGIEGCLRRAREAIYWPNMNADMC